MRMPGYHRAVFLLLMVAVFAAFSRLTTTPLWDGEDAQIICDANVLAADPLPMFGHLGFYFSQPLLQLLLLAEHQVFGNDPGGYIAVNLFIHGLNAFAAFLLVHLLSRRRDLALLSALLFALGVGSYGHALMTIHAVESLLLAGMQVLVLYFFIRNDLTHGGGLRSPLFVAGLLLFVATGLTKAASFSLLAYLVAYKAIFHLRHGRRVLSPDLLVFITVGTLFYLGQCRWGFVRPTIIVGEPTHVRFLLLSARNLVRYLTFMVFPLQQSSLLDTAPAWVLQLFAARTVIRYVLAAGIVTGTVSGIVFGGRACRFVIICTCIALLPFTSPATTGRWLNLSHLYLASLGPCIGVAAGTLACVDRRTRSGIRRLAPYLMPLLLAGASVGLALKLDQKNKARAAWPQAQQLREEVLRNCSALNVEGDSGLPIPLIPGESRLSCSMATVAGIC